jgi:hypothetical protein
MGEQNRNKDAGLPGNGGKYAPIEKPDFEGSLGLQETKRNRRGHDFYPKDFASWPKTYATDGVDTPVKEVLAHYFSAGTDHWIVEADADGYAFGYTTLANHPDGAEWGYIDLPELEAAGSMLNIVERDLCFDKGTLVRDCIPRYEEKRTLVERQRPSQKIPEQLDPSQLADRTDLREVLAAFDGGPDGALDLFVGSILDGQLSRGTPGASGADAIIAWRIEAATQAESTGDKTYTDFKTGVEIATVALMRSKLDPNAPAVDDDEKWSDVWGQAATELARTKRASKNDRALWQFKLQHASNPAQARGMLVAAAALSGTDSWWGFRDSSDRTMLGN